MNFLKLFFQRLLNEIKYIYFVSLNLKVLNSDFYNILINVNKHNKYIVRSLILKAYEKEEITLLLKHFKKNDILLDFGSGIGLVGMIGAKISEKMHVLIEPNTDIFKLLTSNVKLNNIKNVNLLNAVVAINENQKYYFVKKDKYLESYITNDVTNLEEAEIQNMTVLGFNKLITENKISFITCDIEGYEVVLLSDPHIDYSNINGIIVEMHFNNFYVREQYQLMLTNLYKNGFLIHQDSTFDVQYFYKNN